MIEKGAPAYGLAPQAAFCASLILLSFLGFHCACKTLAFFGFGTADARLILILWILGTNIGYYIFKEPAMSEGSTYAFLTIYYYLLMARYNDEGSAAPRSRTILEWGLIGLVLGLAGIVRLQNIAHSVSVPLFIYGRWRRNRASVGDFWTAAGLPLLAATTVCAVIFSIPFEVWNLQGAGIETGVPKSSEFDFATPHVLRILFDPRQHGFLVWHPLFFAAGWGWFLQLRKNRFIALSLLVPAIIQFYLIASWRSYSFGASFGNRGFFTLMPLMLPFFAESIRWAAARPGRHNVFKIAAGILISWNLLLMLFYSAGILAPEGVRITWR
ncbi:hypothetical protein HY256_05940 [Candidatus Sumerlaeota bacterium]|nr:hypothetical protein [Candidatus Sumerlaeota bacterium]